MSTYLFFINVSEIWVSVNQRQHSRSSANIHIQNSCNISQICNRMSILIVIYYCTQCCINSDILGLFRGWSWPLICCRRLMLELCCSCCNLRASRTSERQNDIHIDKLRQICRHKSKNLQIDLPKNIHTGMWIDIHTDRPTEEHTYRCVDRHTSR